MKKVLYERRSVDNVFGFVYLGLAVCKEGVCFEEI